MNVTLLNFCLEKNTRFTELALEEGLLPIEEMNFKDFFEVNRNTGAGRAAFANMKKSGSRRDRNENNTSASDEQHQQQGMMSSSEQMNQNFNMNAAEKEAVWLYRVVMLRKL